MENQIKLFLLCAKCQAEMPAGESPREWQRTQAGWTEKGLQVWCWRHNENVLHLEFKGRKIDTAED